MPDPVHTCPKCGRVIQRVTSWGEGECRRHGTVDVRTLDGGVPVKGAPPAEWPDRLKPYPS